MSILHHQIYRLFSSLRLRCDKYWYAISENWSQEVSDPSYTNIASLENRILFSATPVAELAQITEGNESQAAEPSGQTEESSTLKQTSVKQLVFIDGRLEDPETLADLIEESQDNIEIVVLDPQRNGIQQISESLEGRQNIESIHILSHGTDRGFNLGSEFITDNSLDGYAGKVAQWKNHLSEDADILIYGCDLAASSEGRQLIESLSILSEADVAASDDPTGHHELGGNWELEYSTGLVETEVILPGEAQQQFRELLPNVPPTIKVSGNNSVELGTSYQLHLNLSDADNDTILNWRVDWGDGTTNVYHGDLSSRTVSHTYTTEGFRDILVSVEDVTGVYSNSQAILSSQDTDEIAIYDFEGTLQSTISGGSLNGPESVIMGPDGLLYVGSFHDGTVERYKLDGTFLDTFFDTGPSSGATQLAFDANGNLYVSNFATGQVHKIDRHGNGQVLISSLNSPTGLQIGPDNLLYVSSFNNHSILRFNLDGTALGQYDSGISIGTASYITFGPGGELYVTDRQNNNIVVFNSSGVFDRIISHSSLQTSGNVVRAVSVGPDGNIYVTASDNSNGNNSSTVEIFQPDGTHIKQFVAPPTLRRPHAVLFTPSQQVTITTGNVSLDSTPEILVNSDHAGHPLSEIQHTGQDDRFSSSSIAMSANGQYAVVFTHEYSNGSSAVFYQRFDTDGSKIGAQQRVNNFTAGRQHSASIAMNNSGNFVVSWVSENQDGTSSSIYARQYNSGGTPIANEFLVNDDSSGLSQDQPGSQQNPNVSINDSGQFVVSWDGEGHLESRAAFFKVYNADGSVRHATKSANDFDVGITQRNTVVAIDNLGRVATVWEDNGFLEGSFYNADGSDGNDIDFFPLPSTLELKNPSIQFNSSGLLALAYQERTPDGSGGDHWEIRTQILDRNDVVVMLNAEGNQTTAGDQTDPSVSFNDDGTLLVTWQGSGAAGEAIYGRRFITAQDASGDTFAASLDGEFLISQVAGTQAGSSVASINSNNFAVAWSGEGNGDTNGVFARQFGNTPPSVANDDTASVDENDSLIITTANLLANDIDGLGGGLTFDSFTQPSSGTLVDNGNGTLTYTPTSNFHGNDSFSYTITDANSNRFSATVNITVNSVNSAPVLNTGLSYRANDINEDETNNTGTLVSDFITSGGTGAIQDSDGVSALKGIAITAFDNANGTWQFSTDGGSTWISPGTVNGTSAVLLGESDRFRFVPSANFFGTANLSFRAWDQTSGARGDTGVDVTTNGGNTAFSAATEGAFISVLAVNDQPTSTAIPAVNVNEDSVDQTINLSSFFNDVEDTNLTYTIESNSNSSLVSTSIVGTQLTLSFASNNNGASTLVVRGTDSGGLFAESTINITVNPVNDVPVISSISNQTVPENTGTGPLTFSINDIDSPLGSVTVSAISSNPALIPGGNLTLTNLGGGNWTIDAAPLADQTGTSTIKISVHDGSAENSIAFDLTVSAGTNTAPTTTEISDQIRDEDDPSFQLSLQSAFSDSEQAASDLSYSIVSVSDPNIFTTSINSSNELVITPGLNQHGNATIVIRATDQGGLFVETSFEVTIDPVNDAPVAGDVEYLNHTSNQPFVGNLLLASSDVDGDALTPTILNQPDGGKVTLAGSQFTFTPDPDFAGTTQFQFVVSDGMTTSNIATVVLEIDSLIAPSSFSTSPSVERTVEVEPELELELDESENTEETEETAAVAPVVGNVNSTTDSQQNRTQKKASLDALPLLELEDSDTNNGRSNTIQTASSYSRRQSGNENRSSSTEIQRTSISSSSAAGWQQSEVVLTKALDELGSDIDETKGQIGVVGSTVFVTLSGSSIGVVTWILRSGAMLSSMLVNLPAWRMLDPLTILGSPGSDKDEEQESLQDIIQESEPQANSQSE